MFYFWVWQMLLPMVLGQLDVIVADVIAMLPLDFATYILFGWCYCHVALFFMADGDVITIRLMF